MRPVGISSEEGEQMRLRETVSERQLEMKMTGN